MAACKVKGGVQGVGKMDRECKVKGGVQGVVKKGGKDQTELGAVVNVMNVMNSFALSLRLQPSWTPAVGKSDRRFTFLAF
jgi:NCAIR mutase (PurE)-related protein